MTHTAGDQGTLKSDAHSWDGALGDVQDYKDGVCVVALLELFREEWEINSAARLAHFFMQRLLTSTVLTFPHTLLVDKILQRSPHNKFQTTQNMIILPLL